MIFIEFNIVNSFFIFYFLFFLVITMENYEKLLMLLLLIDAVIFMLSLYWTEFRGLLTLIFFLMAIITGMTINVVREERGTVHERTA